MALGATKERTKVRIIKNGGGGGWKQAKCQAHNTVNRWRMKLMFRRRGFKRGEDVESSSACWRVASGSRAQGRADTALPTSPAMSRRILPTGVLFAVLPHKMSHGRFDEGMGRPRHGNPNSMGSNHLFCSQISKNARKRHCDVWRRDGSRGRKGSQPGEVTSFSFCKIYGDIWAREHGVRIWPRALGRDPESETPEVVVPFASRCLRLCIPDTPGRKWNTRTTPRFKQIRPSRKTERKPLDRRLALLSKQPPSRTVASPLSRACTSAVDVSILATDFLINRETSSNIIP